MAVPHNLVSRDAQIALREFSDQFAEALALGDFSQWATMLGYDHVSSSLSTTFPVPISAAGYKRRDGDDKLRRLFERSLSMKTEEWVDGVEELARIVEAPDFIGWMGEPARIATEGMRHPNVLVADVLASNPLLDFYRFESSGGSVASTIRLFASNHPFNVLDSSVGTFDNDIDYSAGVIDAALVKTVREHFRSIKGANGRPLGLRLSHFLVTAPWEEEALDFFERDTVIQAIQNVAGSENVGGVTQRNRFTQVQVEVADELTGELPSGTSPDDDTIYAFGSRPDGSRPSPWIVQRTGSPEEIRYDKDSEKYKDTGKIGVKYVEEFGVAAALPHAVLRINLSP